MERFDLKDAMTRAQRRYASDGIAEMVLGGLWVFWGTILLGQRLMPAATRAGFGRWAGAVALVLSAVAAQWLMKWLKARWTASRAGYIEPRRPSTVRHAAAVTAGLAVSMLVPLALTRGGLDEVTLLAPAVGVLLACGFAVGQARWSTPSGWLYAAICAATSLVLIAFRVHFQWGLSLLFIALGTSSIGAGWWRFLHFVRAHPEEIHG